MGLIQAFKDAKQALYDHVGFIEDWTVYAIEDRTKMVWMVDEENKFVRFAETQEKMDSDDDYYEDEIYTQRFYSKWVYRGETLTMIMVDTHTDGNKFFAFYDNAKEIKGNS